MVVNCVSEKRGAHVGIQFIANWQSISSRDDNVRDWHMISTEAQQSPRHHQYDLT